MTDFCPGEIVYVSCRHHQEAHAERVRFVRQFAGKYRGARTIFLVLANDKGTELALPMRLVYKSRDDAIERAEGLP